ncbi:WRKY DNA-binding transcription factor 70-like [Primulina tabacum]|uniref:WRKY DNA-binding transcription factor 70-like n=1 Tax=Primulina tabacum TaxID=48773 RepID=UPI003F596A52
MGNSCENLNVIEKRLVEELTKGRESAVQLQALLRKLANLKEYSGQEQLAMKILRSFTEGLSMVASGSTAASAQIDSVDSAGGGAADGGGGGGSASPGGRKKKKKTLLKDRRGYYKRTRTSDSWTRISPTIDDGREWRKYGQKDILNSKHPRCYYRCTHKHQGCKATKQVQKIKEEPLIVYQTTYFNQHTCANTLAPLPHELILESDPPESNLLSFGPTPNPAKISSSEEDKHMVCFPPKSSENPSTWPDAWSPRILVSDDDLEEAVSGLYSCASMTGSQHGIDMEVNQLSDIDFYQI